MEQKYYGIQKDELRMRFTAWLDKVMYHAREDYLKRLRKLPRTVDIDKVPEEILAAEDIYDLWGNGPRDFFFKNKRFNDALHLLTDEQHQLLVMLYIDQMTAREISVALGCTVQNVYNRKSLTLQHLRNTLQEESTDAQSNKQGVSPAPGKSGRR